MGSAASVAVLVGLLAGACSSSASSPSSSKQVTPAGSVAAPSGWSRVDVNTGSVSPIAESVATSGAFYVVSPDRSRVAYDACCGWDRPVRVANIDGTQAHTVSAAGLGGEGEQWSRDGSLLVFQQRDHSTNQLGNLFVQNVVTGQRTQVTNLDESKAWGWYFLFPSFSADGKSVLYQLPRGHQNDNNRLWDLWSVPVTGGTPTLVQRNAGWGGYSPDGKSLAYLSPLTPNFTGKRLWIKSVHGGTPRVLVRGGDLRWLRWSPDGTRIAYANGDAVYTVNPATGTIKPVANLGSQPEWIGDHTLIAGN
jgi:hypothetical protein